MKPLGKVPLPYCGFSGPLSVSRSDMDDPSGAFSQSCAQILEGSGVELAGARRRVPVWSFFRAYDGAPQKLPGS